MTWQDVMSWYTLGSDWCSGREVWTGQWAGRRLVFGGVLRRANRRPLLWQELQGFVTWQDVLSWYTLGSEVSVLA